MRRNIRIVKFVKILLSLFLIAGYTMPSTSATAGPFDNYWIVPRDAKDGSVKFAIEYADGTKVQIATNVFLDRVYGSGEFVKVCSTSIGECPKINGLKDGVRYIGFASNSINHQKFFSVVTKTSYKSKGELSLKQTGLFTLQAQTGIWNPTPTFRFHWLKDGQEITNETQSSLSLRQEDLGHSFQVSVSFALTPYEDVDAQTQTIQTVNPKLPCIANPDPSIWMETSGQPKFTGRPIIGQTLKATTGTWPKDSKLCNFWYSNGSVLGRAGDTAYTLNSSDTGNYVQYIVVATEKDGSLFVRYSNPVLIQKKSFATTSKAPSISGSTSLGGKLTGVNPKWETGTSFTSQWLRQGNLIVGATKSSFTITEGDLGNVLTLKVCGAKKDYETKCLSASKSIPLGQITPAPKVSLNSKTSQVGDVVSLNTGVWPSGVTLSFAWSRDSLPINNQASDAYTISVLDRGHTLSASITATKPGYKALVIPVAIGKIP